ncbi:hypothetical protein LY76DRAFT_575283 [Colletotrichum caudatum]|nr:hypothetical protein LY76DRAFT_575283 [Colletotrichum caudatum]
MSTTATDPPPPHPRLWAGGIDQYLTDNNITCESATPIEAGTSCYLWRLDSFSHPDYPPSEPAVLKCADSTPKFGDAAVSPARLSTEVRALTCSAVAEASRAEPSVRVPRVLATTENGFVMSWAGDLNLLDAFRSGDLKLDMADIGERIGKWLGCLQVASAASGAPGFEPMNPELGRFYNPGGFMDQLVQSVVTDGEESGMILSAMRGKETVRTLAAWDFRPMNNLLRFSGASNNDSNRSTPDIYIVDWELAQFGEAAWDVGMWCVEAMVLEAKHGDRGLLSSFLRAYKAHAGEMVRDDVFVCKVAMIIGLMLVYFMRIAPRLWGSTEEEVTSWRGAAVAFLRAGATGDLAWLRGSLIGILLE